MPQVIVLPSAQSNNEWLPPADICTILELTGGADACAGGPNDGAMPSSRARASARLIVRLSVAVVFCNVQLMIGFMILSPF